MTDISATDLTTNPLYRLADHPPFAQITVAHAEPAIRALLAESRDELAAIEADAPTTWAGLMDRLDRNDWLSKSWGVLAHLMGVRNSDDLRDVYQVLQPEIVEIGNAYGQSRVLYDCYCAIRDGEEFAGLCSAQKRILEAAIQSAELAGVALEGDARDRFGEIAKRLAELSTNFSNHVLDATKAFALELTDLDDVDGLPASLRSLAANTAKSRGHETASAEMGPWVITLDFPSFGPFLQHSTRRELREEVYKAYIQRCSDGEFDNRPLVDEILALRAEQAALLGFANFAEKSLSQKMAPSVEAAESLLVELRDTSKLAGQNELDELAAFAAEKGFDAPEGLAHWDMGFWTERLREEKYDIEQEALRPFFPLPSVLAGLFELVEQIFGVTVCQADGEAEVWNDDVRFFRIEDGGKLLATLYFDPYSRPADKRDGAWVNLCTARSKLHATDGEAARLPVTYMVCNQSPPDGEKPSLMTFGEVLTLFHEFGHALHNMLTEVDYSGAAGFCNVEWDAVELPSQFMENFCTHKPTLAKLAKHYESGETLDEAIMDRLIAARTYRAGSNFLRQV